VVPRQLHHAAAPTSLEAGHLVYINPDDYAEGFWIGEIQGQPADGHVLVQWFELRDREQALADPNNPVRAYAKSPNFDRVPVETIIPGMEPRLQWEPTNMLYLLHDVPGILQAIRTG